MTFAKTEHHSASHVLLESMLQSMRVRFATLVKRGSIQRTEAAHRAQRAQVVIMHPQKGRPRVLSVQVASTRQPSAASV